MNKGDIEMEDVEPQSHTELESVKAPDNSTPDGADLKTAPTPELDASLPNTDDSKIPHEVENGNAQLSVDSAVVEELKKTELEQGQESPLPRKEEEEREVEMVEDQNHPSGEKINGNGEAVQEDEAKGEANGQDSAKIEANGDGDAELQNKAKDEGPHECPPAAETEPHAEVDFTSAVQEQGSTENGEEINDSLDTMMEENPASEIAVEEMGEKPASEIAVEEMGEKPASEIAVEEMGEKPASEVSVEEMGEKPASDVSVDEIGEKPAPEIDVGENPDGEEIGEKPASKIAEEEAVHSHVGELPFQLPVSEIPPKKKEALDEVHPSRSGEIARGLAPEVNHNEGLVKMELDNKPVPAATPVTKTAATGSPFVNKPSPATPDLSLKYSSRRSAGYSGSAVHHDAKMSEDVEGTPEQQAAFIKELEVFYRQRGVDFKTPKFYGNPLNCYKLWTSVIRLGGYDLVTGTKLWRQIGESFHPPKTCTTVSWTFRIFYEKSLLDYERYKVQNGEVELPAALPEPPSADNEGNGHQASGSGRARRDSATRAMQGWHAQRLYGEDKSPNSMQKRENKIKSIGSLKQKRPNEGELQPFVKTPRTETPKQLVPTIADVGPPADWVKINVRETKDCFEVYALVPGLLREEVRVQSDPAGRLVITGQPEQTENPWGITSFRKVVSLPGRIDPLGTSAVVSLHGRLFVRVPFEQATTN